MPRSISDPPRLLHVQEFLLSPADAGSTRAHEHLIRLTAAGFHVTALAGPWNPLTGGRAGEARSDAPRVCRLALLPPPLGRYARGLTQAANALLILPHVLARARSADLILFSTPPLLPGLACTLAARLFGIPLVVEWRDLWPEAHIALGRLAKNAVASRMLARAARLIGDTAIAHVALTPALATTLTKRHPETPVLLLPNRPARTELMMAPRAARRRLPLAVAWFGHLNDGNDPAILPELARAARGLVEFHLFGDGPFRARLERERSRGDLPNLLLRGPVARRDLPRALEAMDAALVCLPRDPAGFLDCVLPNKLADAMGFRLPVLLLGAGDAARELSESGAGIVVPRGVNELPAAVAALRRLAASPALRETLGAAGVARIRTLGTREETGDHLAEYLKNVIHKTI